MTAVHRVLPRRWLLPLSFAACTAGDTAAAILSRSPAIRLDGLRNGPLLDSRARLERGRDRLGVRVRRPRAGAWRATWRLLRGLVPAAGASARFAVAAAACRLGLGNGSAGFRGSRSSRGARRGGRALSALLRGEERKRLVERHGIRLVAVGKRRVDVAVLHIRAVAPGVQLDGLLVARMRTEDAQCNRCSRPARARPFPPPSLRTRTRSCHRVAGRGTPRSRAWSAPKRTAADRSCRSPGAFASAHARSAVAGSRGRNGNRTSCPALPPFRTRRPAATRRRASRTSGTGPAARGR